MRSEKLSVGSAVVLAFFALTLTTLGTPIRAAAQETVLYNFTCGTEPCEPSSDLVFDAAGNLYGTTPYGGAYNSGTVFELSPQAGGGWAYTILYNFNDNDRGVDGFRPQNSLVFDASGNLYGTTQDGGVHGGGTVFELTPGTGGVWTETVLHSFGNGKGPDGSEPYSSLIFDAAGNLYGTTSVGGAHGLGTVFELSSTGGVWTEKQLHSFGGAPDGSGPYAGLIFDAAGNLYGTTNGGGADSGGTVFELIPQTDGQWKTKVLYSFGQVNAEGWSTSEPYAGVILDQAGNLYGTTYYGGPEGGGIVYELSPTTDGPWKLTPVHGFNSSNTATSGANLYAGLIFDAAGNLYGTAVNGGNHGKNCSTTGCGTVFELSPTTGGAWTETVLVAFDYTDGGNPLGGVIFDAAGNLYGTTAAGGSGVFGTVFEIAH